MVKVSALRANGLTWPVIAERLGVKRASLTTQFCKWKKHGAGPGWAKYRRTQRMIELAEAGWTTRRIADEVGSSIANVIMALNRHGVDAELRALYQAEPIRRTA
jgi:transcriptional regulator